MGDVQIEGTDADELVLGVQPGAGDLDGGAVRTDRGALL
jgi:hypothetical protein